MAAIRKRSLSIAGHRTSISLEEPFWQLLQSEAVRQEKSLAALVEEIDRERRGVNLSSAIRVHLLETLMKGGKARVTGIAE